MKYVCELCGMIYDETQGDSSHGIPAGTVFAELPPYYECPRCGSEREAFSRLMIQRKTLRKELPVEAPNAAFWQNAKYSDLCFESDR